MEEIFTKLCMLVNVEKHQEPVEDFKDNKNAKDLLLAAKLTQQAEASDLKFISQKLQTRKKFKEKKPKKKPKVRKTLSDNCLITPAWDDDVFSNAGSDCSSEWSRNSRSGRCSLDSGVSLECPSLSLAWEMRDPDRDCANFDPVQRAKELFEALDIDGDGVVTEDEFIDGCMKDDVFIMLLQKFNGDEFWEI